MNNRDKHSRGVAILMKELAEIEKPGDIDFAEDMFLLGFLHDIGYTICENLENHARVGGELLKRNNYVYWEEILHHGKLTTEYSSCALDILNRADLLVNHIGERVTVDERLKSVSERYGSTSPQYVDFVELANKYYK